MYKRSFTSLTIRVYLHASKTHTYTATLGSPCGDILVASVREPNLSSCRALKARGMTGPVHFYRAGRDEPDLIVPDLEKSSKWTVRETEKQEPKLVRYRPPVRFMKDVQVPDPKPLEERPGAMDVAGLA
jgi:hypothetical protein